MEHVTGPLGTTEPLGSTLLVDAAFTWSWNHFHEQPVADITQVVDNTQIYGLPGQRDNSMRRVLDCPSPTMQPRRAFREMSPRLSVSFGGSHSISAGYTWQFPHYNDITTYSGGRFIVPELNATAPIPV